MLYGKKRRKCEITERSNTFLVVHILKAICHAEEKKFTLILEAAWIHGYFCLGHSSTVLCKCNNTCVRCSHFVFFFFYSTETILSICVYNALFFHLVLITGSFSCIKCSLRSFGITSWNSRESPVSWEGERFSPFAT